MKRLAALLLTGVLVAGSLAGCVSKKEPPATEGTAAATSGDVIKIGVFEPLTGGNAAGGEMTLEGIKLANELKPEILGKKVELVVVDNKSDKVEAANAAARLIDNDKVNAIIGSYGSSLSMAAGDLVKKAQVPAVGCSPTNPLVTKDNDYYFRVCFIDPFQGTVMAKYAYETLGARKAAIIKDVQQDYSVGLCNYFVEAFKKLTGDENCIVAEASYNSGDQDFSAQLTNVNSKSPDVIFAPGNYGECALMIKQAREMNIKTSFLGGDTWEAEEFVSIGGPAVEGATYSSHFSAAAPVTPESTVFLDAYKKKFNKEANTFGALGYDAYMAILNAIEKAGSAEPQKIQEALKSTKDFVGATGIITLDENGDAVKDAVINKAENSKFVYVTTVKP